jgi:hypothetical protein
MVALCVGQMKVNFGLIWEPICNKVLPFADTVSKEESLHLSGTWGENFALNSNKIVIDNWKQYSLSCFPYYQILFTFIYSWLRFFQFCGVGGLVIVLNQSWLQVIEESRKVLEPHSFGDMVDKDIT